MRNDNTSRSAGSSSTTRTARRVFSMSFGNVNRCPTPVKERAPVERGGVTSPALSAANDDQEGRRRPELLGLFDRQRTRNLAVLRGLRLGERHVLAAHDLV